MSWKNWPAWLKGGVIGIIFFIIVLLSYIIFNIFTGTTCATDQGAIDNCGVQPVLLWGIPEQIILLPVNLLAGVLQYYAVNYIYKIILLLFVEICFWFAIGALIGFIIGKIKSRKEKQNEPN